MVVNFIILYNEQQFSIVEEKSLGSPENIGSLFYCCSALERKTSEMYNELSRKFDQPTIKRKMVIIAEDSLKHCNLFEELSKNLIKKRPTEKECKKSLSETWKQVNEITKSLKKHEILDENESFEIINRLAVLENRLGEEYSTLEKLKMLTYMSNEISEKYGIDLSSIKDVLDAIIMDEKQHAYYLFEIYEILKKKSKKPDSSPEFKYQNPDAWLTPSHSQKTEHVI